MEKKLHRITYANSTLPESYVFDGGREDKQIPIIFSVFLLRINGRNILVDAGCDTMPGFEMQNFNRFLCDLHFDRQSEYYRHERDGLYNHHAQICT